MATTEKPQETQPVEVKMPDVEKPVRATAGKWVLWFFFLFALALVLIFVL